MHEILCVIPEMHKLTGKKERDAARAKNKAQNKIQKPKK